MSLYEEFEKRHTGSWFSAGWSEVEVRPSVSVARKDLTTLENELLAIKEEVEKVKERQFRLNNLSKFYNDGLSS